MPSFGGSSRPLSAAGALFLLFLHQVQNPTNAQGALHIQLASDCTVCITVNADVGEFALLQKGDCRTTASRDKLWLMAQDASDGGGWWCLDDNPKLCVEEGGTLLLSTESETSPYQQFAFTDALRSETGGLIIGGESDACVTMVTGGVLMNDCAADGDTPTRQLWKAVEKNAPLCPEGEEAGGEIGNGGGGFIGDETTLPDPSRILMFLQNDCNRCIGVEAAEADSPLRLVSCKDTPGILTLWSLDLLVGSSIAQSVCLESNPDLCIVESEDEAELRLGQRPKSAYIMNKFIDDQIESLDEVGYCIAFVGGDRIELEECSTSKSGQYWTKQGEAYWTEECANTPKPTPRPTAAPTKGPTQPSRMTEEVPWWTILLVVIGAIMVGMVVYYLASLYLASKRHKEETRRRRRSSRSIRQNRQTPELS